MRSTWKQRCVKVFLMLNLPSGSVRAIDKVDVDGTVEEDLGTKVEGSGQIVLEEFVFF